MGLVPDEGAAWEFAPASPDPAFHDRVHARRPDAAKHSPDPGIGEDRAECRGVGCAAVADHELDSVRLLATVCGPIVGGAAQEADRLSDVLGDDHDLGVLRATLAEESPALAAVDVDSLLPLIGHRREELQAEAWHLGRRLYAEKAKTFERRLHRLWQAGQMPRTLRTETD